MVYTASSYCNQTVDLSPFEQNPQEARETLHLSTDKRNFC